jgi:hypothetical protein
MIELVYDEDVGMECLQTLVGVEYPIGKVLRSEGNDRLRATANCRRQHMSSLGLGKFNPRNERLVTRNHVYAGANPSGSLAQRFSVQIRPPPHEILEVLVDDELGPRGMKGGTAESRRIDRGARGQPEEKLPNRPMKDSRVVNDDEGHGRKA